MGFREVPVFEVKEVLRLWLRGEGLRATERLARVDRKTIRRYEAAAGELGVDRDGGEEQVSDEVLAAVLERVRPHRSSGHGESWRTLECDQEQIRAWLDDEGLSVVKVHTLLARQGVTVPKRTSARFCAEPCGPRRGQKKTVRVADGEPGVELQVDFGRMGLMYDPDTDRRRVLQALIFTPCVSRYCFVWFTFTQMLADILGGFEAAWAFFGGIFAVVIPDNMAAIVDKA